MSLHTLKHSRSQSLSPSSVSKRIQTLPETTPLKFLILSDTHDSECTHYPKCDVVLHCGDLTEDGSPESISNALKSLGKIQAELKLVIAGNHEISLDKEYYMQEGGSEATHQKSRALISGADSEAQRNGVTFLDEGTYAFTLKSGASFRIYASPYTPKYGASAFQYPTNENRYSAMGPEWATSTGTKASIIPQNVDIVMTHGPPQYILDGTADGRSAGCPHLRQAISRVRPRLHCFGHIHRGYGAQRIEYDISTCSDKDFDPIRPLPKEWVGKNQAKKKGYASLPPSSAEAFRGRREQTLMVNASIMNGDNEPGNVPWLVELDLPMHNSKHAEHPSG